LRAECSALVNQKGLLLSREFNPTAAAMPSPTITRSIAAGDMTSLNTKRHDDRRPCEPQQEDPRCDDDQQTRQISDRRPPPRNDRVLSVDRRPSAVWPGFRLAEFDLDLRCEISTRARPKLPADQVSAFYEIAVMQL
jgi:hypothetical protein